MSSSDPNILNSSSDDSSNYNLNANDHASSIPSSNGGFRPIDIVIALYDYNYPNKASEQRLSLQQGVTVYVISKSKSGWWDGLTIDSNDGKVNRGWFPQTYVKSIKDRRMSSISNMSSRRPSYASANTPPNMPTNYLSLPVSLPNKGKSKSRRGSSSLSYNSYSNPQIRSGQNKESGNVLHNDSSQVDPLQKNETNSSSLPKGINKAQGSSITEKESGITVLSLEEVEMIIGSVHGPLTSTWTPVPMISNGRISDKLLYYNSHLNIYCNELPLVSMKTSNLSVDDTIDESGTNLMDNKNELTFPTDDQLVDLTAKDLSPCDKRPNLNKSATNQEHLANKKPPFKNIDNKEKSVDVGTAEKDETEERESDQSSSIRKAMMSTDELFYLHSKDVKTWSELEELTSYFTNLAHNMFLKNDRYTFIKFFDIVSNLVIFTQLSCRLIQNQIKQTSSNREIKKIFKSLITSLSKININSTLYFDSSYQWLVSSKTTPNKFNTTDVSVSSNAHDNSKFNIPYSPEHIDGGHEPLEARRNASTSTTETVTPYKAFRMGSDDNSANFQRVSSATSQRPSMQTALSDSRENSIQKPNVLMKDSKISMRLIFENIDQELNKFLKTIQSLHKVLQKSVVGVDNNTLPQVLPRFFRGSFNGGSWSNPFSVFIYPVNGHMATFSSSSSSDPYNLTSPMSGNIPSKNNDGTTAVGPPTLQELNTKIPNKMANAIALAAGLPAGSITNEDLSANSMSYPNLSGGTLPSRPSHNRTFSRSRVSKRKSKYPLNNETVAILRRVSQEIYEKFSLANGGELDVLNQPRTKVRNLELNSKTYEQMNKNTVLIEVLENLDLTIFINLKRLIKFPTKELDNESSEFLKHAMTSIAGVLTEFFDIKQAFHDILIRLIMSTQHTTLDDPYIFSSMRSNFKVGYNEPALLPKTYRDDKLMKKMDKKALNLFKYLVQQDVEFNDIEFLDLSDDFKISCEKYVEIADVACLIVEQLVEEKENLLNYAARMMKNNLTTELLRGEQEKWFEYNSDEEEKDEEDYLSDTVQGKDASVTKKKKYYTDLPWFLQPEFEHTLIYDIKGNVKGGTKEALIEYLTNPELIDPSFNVAFLITFRSIFTTKEFFYSLIYRYNLYPPEGLSYDEYNIWIEKKLKPIKCRVVSILKTFFQQYWNPNYTEPGLSSIENFAQFAISEKVPGSDELLQEIKEYIIDPTTTPTHIKEKNGESEEKLTSSTELTPKSSIETKTKSKNKLASGNMASSSPSSFFRLKKLKLLDIDPYNYATQLTILSHYLYLRITMFECLDRVWGTKYCNMGGSLNISNLIKNANAVTNYVSYSIVKQSDVKKRSKVIQFFIKVAEYCKELNNFSSMTAIVSGLYSSPVYRLKKTWQLIPSDLNETLRNLNNLMDSKRNFIRYRGLLESVKNVACVPFFGVYLSDLTFTFAGNPEFLHGSNSIINFSKRNKIVDIIEEILSYKRVHYKLKRMDEIQAFIEGSLEKIPHIEKQYYLSLEMEPRITNSATGSVDTNLKSQLELSSENNSYTVRSSDTITATTTANSRDASIPDKNDRNSTNINDTRGNDDRNNNFLKFGKKKQSSKLFG
ncbi:hypothetical protein KAFR_0I01330 [Kazachstania africana CBS 2517]|uniref:Cell division control protein 25 n=1 Tax=Kazachstania africana (strain ATCC 22294 / BCRC 22015 / CBS 2517 / CECT 1963 / NBRC 1671 / NRRL Y-8276) TaxID=1071382 RepID=H2AZW4_KAZAF|nr:hypothetical protein KAFR_0I01330 [Kazachstania africana CBS 2517]CCF59914.1 hypothetical protein KAFR_0I01330 [Kazachstania africana CBS 2517]